MSARVVLAVAVVLAAGPARADQKVAPSDVSVPMETVQSSGGGGSEWTKDSSSDSHAYAKDSSSDSRSDSRDYVKDSSSDSHAYARSSSDYHKTSNAGQRHTAERSRGGESHASRPPQTAAQQRHPRPGTGTGRFDNDGHRGSRGPRYAWGSSYYGYGRYGYYYNPYDYWYSPFYYSGYYGYSPSYYRRGRGYGYGYRDSGSLRIIVDPEKTRVYVDGYYAGIADDFDGILQRLNVPPGRHEITLKLEGYRTQHFKVYVPVDDTIKIHYDMVRGSGEATSEEFAGVPSDYARVEDMDDRDTRRGDDDGRYDRRDDGRDDRRDDRADPGDTGSVRLQVNPGDASVYVDGEFRGSGRQSANLRLRPGRHRIEVVRPGYRTVEREVEVERGRSTELQFDLERI